ncbi:hypothetical protein [Paenibacillus sp. OK060]|nr:hypothetical protein [Paenibacillus sp. OK060]
MPYKQSSIRLTSYCRGCSAARGLFGFDAGTERSLLIVVNVNEG